MGNNSQDTSVQHEIASSVTSLISHFKLTLSNFCVVLTKGKAERAKGILAWGKKPNPGGLIENKNGQENMATFSLQAVSQRQRLNIL